MSKRLIQELVKYQIDKKQLISNGLLHLGPENPDDLTHWVAAIAPTRDESAITSFQDTVWFLDITCPEQYPSKPPKVKFHVSKAVPDITTTIDVPEGKRVVYRIPPPHVNINFQTGEICLDILREEWSPAWTLSSVCVAVVVLLTQGGEAGSPLNVDLANLKNIDQAAMRGLIDYYINRYGEYPTITTTTTTTV